MKDIFDSFFVIPARFPRSGFFFAYNTPFLSMASGEVLKAGQSFDAGDKKRLPK